MSTSYTEINTEIASFVAMTGCLVCGSKCFCLLHPLNRHDILDFWKQVVPKWIHLLYELDF